MHYVWVALIILAWPSVSFAAEDPTTAKQIAEILIELKEIHRLLNVRSAEGPAGAADVTVDFSGAPVLGSNSAPLTIVEFTDYQCNFCRQFFKETFPKLKQELIDSGKVRFVSLDLPLDGHKNAVSAAQAGRCAAEQGKFWVIHEKMQSGFQDFETVPLTGLARENGLDADAFRQCMESGRHREAVQLSARLAASKGARGTPAFVIGKSTKTGVEGELVVGTLSYESLLSKLDQVGRR